MVMGGKRGQHRRWEEIAAASSSRYGEYTPIATSSFFTHLYNCSVWRFPWRNISYLGKPQYRSISSSSLYHVTSGCGYPGEETDGTSGRETSRPAQRASSRGDKVPTAKQNAPAEQDTCYSGLAAFFKSHSRKSIVSGNLLGLTKSFLTPRNRAIFEKKIPALHSCTEGSGSHDRLL